MNNTTVNMTVSEEKIWMKYYSEESRNAKMPQCKAFDYVLERIRIAWMRLRCITMAPTLALTIW